MYPVKSNILYHHLKQHKPNHKTNNLINSDNPIETIRM
jgi:hypothetical protein